ncbi:MAG: electron-transfer flavoprotein:ubiquinone oxidoreductase [Gemmatimonadota bacterium]|nr:electron-transfer flavoprotein:ubiquinone oxidoreductase [Gemmatimonadota bacterium]MDE3012501.1 electron-transfer flavoprotein:ubiquinone oxidoreductase [Gemmatimonadota bacterium]
MSEGTAVLKSAVHSLDAQPPLPRDRFIVAEQPDEEAIPMDVVFVGGGPGGLAGAIELARLVKEDNENGGGIGEIEIAVLEKAGQLGEHNLSGAVVNPSAFRELFPDLSMDDLPLRRPVTKESVYVMTESKAYRIPTPPTMKNHGNWIGSISEIVRWLGEQAEGLGVNVFPGFPVDSLLVEDTNVIGVRTTPSGLGRDGEPASADAMPAVDLTAQVTVLSEGSRGPLSQAWFDWQDVKAENPQIYALGVKEIWEVKKPLDRIIHTMAWPLPTDAFGGSFAYPLSDNTVAMGLVVGLDYGDARLDVHELLQRMKLHPLFRAMLEGGEMIEWGAKTIPEGGFYSVAERRHGDGLIVIGDAAGYVEVSSLKGIHYAMHSGVMAARQIFEALKKGGTSADALAGYTAAVDNSVIMKDLKERRNMRLAFKGGFLSGGVKAGLMTLTKGAFPGGKIAIEEDAADEKHLGPEKEKFVPDGKLTFSKVDAVYKSGNQTRDDIPSHLIVGEDVSPEVAEMYVHLCPAGVYERDGDKLVVNAPNCVDCKATDVLGPRWTPREGGSGPAYRQM